MDLTRRQTLAGIGVAAVGGGWAVTNMGGCGPGEDTIDSLDESPLEGPRDLVSITGKVVERRAGSVVIDDGTGTAIAGTRGEPVPSMGACVTVEGEPQECIGCGEDTHAIETWGFFADG